MERDENGQKENLIFVSFVFLYLSCIYKYGNGMENEREVTGNGTDTREGVSLMGLRDPVFSRKKSVFILFSIYTEKAKQDAQEAQMHASACPALLDASLAHPGACAQCIEMHLIFSVEGMQHQGTNASISTLASCISTYIAPYK